MDSGNTPSRGWAVHRSARMSINTIEPHWLAADRVAIRLFMMAAGCIVVAAALGLITSLKIVEPGFASNYGVGARQ